MLGSMVARAIIDSFNYICGESVTNWNVNAKDLNDELKSLRITYVAFQKYLENQSNMVLPAHPMFTQQQLFFIAYMQSKRTIVDDQRLDHLLTQLPEFNAAFGGKDVDVMIEYEQ
ncbi:hypothetical protein HDV02_000881 [Globomyces sp. JEL0801]|nr:hypothetical protein HDV02_000881 [Globomyces sp. JEL0801]